MSEKDSDLCAICRNQGTDECGGCEIPHAYLNLFQLDENKVIRKPNVKLYAHWVNCIREECPESKDKKCTRGLFTQEKCDPVPFPEDGKCLFPIYIPLCCVENNGAFELHTVFISG